MRRAKASRYEPIRSLRSVPSGQCVLLAGVDVPAEHRLRLAELGIRPGDAVRVLGRTVGGGRILGVGTSRLAIDRSVAEQLRVQPVAGG